MNKLKGIKGKYLGPHWRTSLLNPVNNWFDIFR